VADQTFEHHLGVMAGRFRCSPFFFAVGTIAWRPLLAVSIGGSTQTHGILLCWCRTIAALYLHHRRHTMLKALLVDVDGVLAIGPPFSTSLARDYGITPEATTPFFQGRFRDCLVGTRDLKEELEHVLPSWGWYQSVDAFLEYWFTSEHVINTPLVEVIQRFRRRSLDCYLATNQERYRTKYLLRDMGFAKLFDGMFSSADVGCMKHDSLFFTRVIQQLGEPPAEDLLFWDDSPGNVATAGAVGLRAERYLDVDGFERVVEGHFLQP